MIESKVENNREIKNSTFVEKMLHGSAQDDGTDLRVSAPPCERSRFANITKLDEKLEQLGIKWNTAVELVKCARDGDDFVDWFVVKVDSECMEAFIDEGRKALDDGCIWMVSDHVMRAVATPGVQMKTKQFQLRLIETERMYARHTNKVVLMPIRV